MSHLVLQRVMVRMLFDHDFAERVLASADTELADEQLTAQEIAWLLRPDRRAWQADQGRPNRALSVLLQEYPASFALMTATEGSLDPISGFFSSQHFRSAVEPSGSMALNFGAYLCEQIDAGRVRDRRVLALARLEQAIARLHRTSSSLAPASGYEAQTFRFSPDKSLHRAPSGTADLHEEIHRALAGAGRDLSHAVLEPPPMPGLVLDLEREEPLMLELARDDGPRVKFLVGTAEITEELFELLDYARVPRAFDELRIEVTRLGAEEDDSAEIIAGLIEDGTLVPHR